MYRKKGAVQSGCGVGARGTGCCAKGCGGQSTWKGVLCKGGTGMVPVGAGAAQSGNGRQCTGREGCVLCKVRQERGGGEAGMKGEKELCRMGEMLLCVMGVSA